MKNITNLIRIFHTMFLNSRVLLCLGFLHITIFQYVANGAQEKSSYYAQLKAVESLEELSVEKKRLSSYSIPVQIEEFKKESKILYRIRIGSFNDSLHAILLCTILGYRNPWIIKYPQADNTTKGVDILSIDTIIAPKSVPSIFISDNGLFCSIYIKNYGFEASVEPSAMLIYTSDFKDRVKVKDVSGFKATDSSVLFGKVLFISSDPDGIFKFDEKARKMIKKYSSTIKDADSSYSLFKDCSEKRLNVLMEYSFKNQKIIDKAEKGFDYADEKGALKLWRQCLEGKSLGNANIMQVSSTDSTIHSFGDKIIVSALIDNEYYLVLSYKVRGK